VSTLAEIEAAATTLPPEEKQKLILFLIFHLRDEGARLPAPRDFSSSEIESWIATDEADMRRFQQGA
jgi:hypothetical protein